MANSSSTNALNTVARATQDATALVFNPAILPSSLRREPDRFSILDSKSELSGRIRSPPFNISRDVRWKFGCRSTAAGRSKCVLRLYSIRKLHISIGLFLARLLTQLSWTFGLGVKGSTLKATAPNLPRLLSSRRVENRSNGQSEAKSEYLNSGNSKRARQTIFLVN